MVLEILGSCFAKVQHELLLCYDLPSARTPLSGLLSESWRTVERKLAQVEDALSFICSLLLRKSEVPYSF